MEKHYEKSITWTIKNFSSLPSQIIRSDYFVVGPSKWCLSAYPKGDFSSFNKHFSLYLDVSDSISLPHGWKRDTKFCLTVVNQFSEALSQQRVTQNLFQNDTTSFGYTAMFPLSKLLDKNGGFLVNDEVKIVAKVTVLDVIAKSDVLEETSLANESIDVNGFQVLHSQVESVNNLFLKHPDFASNFHPKNPHLRTAYLNCLLSLIETLDQTTKELSIDDLTNAYSTLSYLTKSGFRLDWLELKIRKVSVTRVSEIEKELKDLKHNCSQMEAFLEFLRKIV